MSNKYRGLLLVVSSPSGAGKTTVCTRLRQEFAQLRFSVSYTTRPPRPGWLKHPVAGTKKRRPSISEGRRFG